MPIKPENQHLYPDNWKSEIRPAILKRAKNCCEKCKTPNYEYGFRDINGNWYSSDLIIDSLEIEGYDYFEHQLSHIDIDKKPTKIVLTIAHKDHDPTNNDFSNLAAWCQKCHLDYDRDHHMKNARVTREKKTKQIKINF